MKKMWITITGCNLFILGTPLLILGLLMVDAFVIFMGGAINIIPYDSVVSFIKFTNACAFAAMAYYSYYVAKNDNEMPLSDLCGWIETVNNEIEAEEEAGEKQKKAKK